MDPGELLFALRLVSRYPPEDMRIAEAQRFRYGWLLRYKETSEFGHCNSYF